MKQRAYNMDDIDYINKTTLHMRKYDLNERLYSESGRFFSLHVCIPLAGSMYGGRRVRGLSRDTFLYKKKGRTIF